MPDTTSVVEVSSIHDSKITHVSLYSGLAEITRVYKVKLKAGDNKVVISDLPNTLVQDSLRVEGRGACTIHEVAISKAPAPTVKSSAKLKDLRKEESRVQKALDRKIKAIKAISSFYNSLTVDQVDAIELVETTKQLESVHGEVDDKLLNLEEKLEVLQQQIKDECQTLDDEVKGKKHGQLGKCASITIVTEKDIDVDMVLIYGVSNATWTATYDIYVKMDTKEKAVSLIYKAAILQSTGEAWDDVSLTLETAIPTFGLSIPELAPWTLSTYRPPIIYPYSMSMPMPVIVASSRSSSSSRSPPRRRRRSPIPSSSAAFALIGGCDEDSSTTSVPIINRDFLVSSKGDINASFSVPGLISIPSDNDSHNVTIVELPLNASMSWISIPKKETKAHLTAKIKNDSDYTLLSGIASVYVDGSFISRSDVPVVSPQESFDCPLGLDLTIRLVYHPRTKKMSRSGLILTGKTTSYVFEQRISIYNTKPVSITGLKILDQIPVSDNSKIIVNMANPPLVLPQPNKKGLYSVPKAVTIGSQAVAQWKDADEPDIDPSLLGKDGEFSWVCNIPAQGTLNLLLSWEVVYPYASHVIGLDM
ncbi:hypothetical protein BYT27DRAFT_7197229 [Phlegmacium glaucopus]|nr:hypothetical protein BYT27DRAFT_7197229 [Phlegmacium glaucopus]